MLNIAGWQKVSLIDYPEKVATSIFLAGCNFRCSYCHNPQLVDLNPNNEYIKQAEVFDYLELRKKTLDGVCLSGGEPLLFPELEEFIKKIKALGYAIKLDTNGTNPQFLAKLISANLLDYIAMDIKASLDQYSQITRVKVDFNRLLESIKIIMNSGLDYEFRTTVLPRFHNLAEIPKIGKMIAGANKYFLQQFNNRIVLDPKFMIEPSFTDQQLEELRQEAQKYVKICQIRG